MSRYGMCLKKSPLLLALTVHSFALHAISGTGCPGQLYIAWHPEANKKRIVMLPIHAVYAGLYKGALERRDAEVLIVAALSGLLY